MKKILIIISGLLWVLVCCAPAPDSQIIPTFQPVSSPQETPETEMEVTPVTDSTTPTAIPDTSIQALIDLAKEDLSVRLEVHIDEINVMQAKTVTWPDASLGCPQPGMQYKQVPEDGALIIFQVEGINYEYHSGGSRGLFLCEKTYKDLSPPPKIDLFNLTPSKSDSDSTTPDNGIPPGEDQ